MAEAAREGTAGVQPRTNASAEIDARLILKLGLGGFASLGGALWLAVCAMLVWHALERLAYAVKSEPVVIQPAQVHRARHGEYVRITGELQLDRRQEIESAGRRFTLTPLADTAGRLLVYRAACPEGGAPLCEIETITGRLVARDWSGQWHLGDVALDVASELSSRSVAVPDSALVLIAGDVPRFELWPKILGSVGACVWLWFVLRAIHTARLFSSRERLAAALSQIDESDDDELVSVRLQTGEGRPG